MLQSRILRGRIKQATDLRLTGNSKFDAVATLTAFDQSGRDLTVLNLHHNRLSGFLPESLTQCTKLKLVLLQITRCRATSTTRLKPVPMPMPLKLKLALLRTLFCSD